MTSQINSSKYLRANMQSKHYLPAGYRSSIPNLLQKVLMLTKSCNQGYSLYKVKSFKTETSNSF